jgi:hypothetical protein
LLCRDQFALFCLFFPLAPATDRRFGQMTPWPVLHSSPILNVAATRGEVISFTWSERELLKLALTFHADAGYHGMRQAELEPQATGTRVTGVQRATIDSPLGRVMARLFFNPQTFAKVYLQALIGEAER